MHPSFDGCPAPSWLVPAPAGAADAVDLGARAKCMRNVLGIRPTVSLVNRTLHLQLLSVEVRRLSDIAPGVQNYRQDDYRNNAFACYPPDSDPAYARDKWGSRCFLLCVDSHGVRYDLQVADPAYDLWVLVPEDCRTADMHTIVDSLESDLRIPRQSLTVRFDTGRDFVGWCPNDEDPSRRRQRDFCVVSFPCPNVLRSAVKVLTERGVSDQFCQKRRLQVMEGKIDAVQKAYDHLPVKPLQWMRVSRWEIPDRYYTHAQVELSVRRDALSRMEDREDIAPMWQLSFDIETYGTARAFSNPRIASNAVIQITTVAYQEGGAHRIDLTHYLGDVDRTLVGDVLIDCVDDEQEMLARWRDLVVLDVQPFMMLGYNIDGFDTAFMWLRSQPPEHHVGRVEEFEVQEAWQKRQDRRRKEADKARKRGPCSAPLVAVESSAVDDPPPFPDLKKLGAVKGMVKHHGGSRYRHLGAFIHERCEMEVKDVSGQGRGKGVRHNVVHAGGRINVDLMYVLMQTQGLSFDQYGLKWVAAALYPTDESVRKIDLTPQQIWVNHDSGPVARAQTVVYGMRDAVIPWRIARDRMVFASIGALASLARTPIEDTIHRGQTTRVFNLIVEYCHANGYTINADHTHLLEENVSLEGVTFQGATVFATPGFHANPLFLNDFESLYPSIMEANNLCVSTHLTDQRLVQKLVRESKRSPLPANGMYTSSCEDYVHPSGLWYRIYSPAPGEKHCFVQSDPGVLPLILKMLKARRKHVREVLQRKHSKGSVMWQVYEALQLAIKILANSVYGFMGSVRSNKYAEGAVSSTVTSEGRQMIEFVMRSTDTEFASFADRVRIASRYDPRSGCPRCGFRYPSLPDRTSCDACPSGMPEHVEDHRTIVATGGVKVRALDTDSSTVATRLPATPEGVRLAEVLGKVTAKYMTNKFHPAITFAYECTMPQVLTFKKKRYVYWDAKGGGLKAKGIEIKRRDNWSGLRTTFTRALEALLRDRSPDDCVAVLVADMRRIVANELPISDYVVTKALKDDYSAMTSKPAHLVVAEKMGKRMPGSEPIVGSRVPFVITTVGTTISERAEDPAYAEANGIPIDRLYYMDKFRTTLLKMVDLIFFHGDGIFKAAIDVITAQQTRGTRGGLLFVIPPKVQMRTDLAKFDASTAAAVARLRPRPPRVVEQVHAPSGNPKASPVSSRGGSLLGKRKDRQ